MVRQLFRLSSLLQLSFLCHRRTYKHQEFVFSIRNDTRPRICVANLLVIYDNYFFAVKLASIPGIIVTLRISHKIKFLYFAYNYFN